MKIVFDGTIMKLIYRDRREGENDDWITYDEFDPLNVMKEKQAVRAPDMFRGKCIYARRNQYAEDQYR